MQEAMLQWANKNNYVILDCSTKDHPNKYEYAEKCGAIVVADPRPGKSNNTLIVKVHHEPT